MHLYKKVREKVVEFCGSCAAWGNITQMNWRHHKGRSDITERFGWIRLGRFTRNLGNTFICGLSLYTAPTPLLFWVQSFKQHFDNNCTYHFLVDVTTTKLLCLGEQMHDSYFFGMYIYDIDRNQDLIQQRNNFISKPKILVLILPREPQFRSQIRWKKKNANNMARLLSKTGRGSTGVMSRELDSQNITVFHCRYNFTCCFERLVSRKRDKYI